MADHGRLQVYVILYQRNHLFANKKLHGCNIKPIFVAIGSQMFISNTHNLRYLAQLQTEKIEVESFNFETQITPFYKHRIEVY